MNQSCRGRTWYLATVIGLAALLSGGCDNRGDAPATSESIAQGGSNATAGGNADTGISGASDVHNTRKRVVVLGTSLTAGLGLDPDQAWPAVVQRKANDAGLDIEVVNAGLSGETSAGALRRVDWVLNEPAAAVVLEVGANDGLRGVDPDSTHANLVALIRRVKELRPGARVFLVQMEAPRNLGAAYTTAFHNAFVEAAKSEKVELLPFLLDGVAGVAALNQNDGIHPNEEGARIVGEQMWQALRVPLADVAIGSR